MTRAYPLEAWSLTGAFKTPVQSRFGLQTEHLLYLRLKQTIDL
jgi:hypothetical protein